MQKMKEQQQPKWAAAPAVFEKGDEIEAEFVPLSPRRLRQVGIIAAAALVLGLIVLVVVLSNQAEEATRAGNAAATAQSRAVVQLTAVTGLSNETERLAVTAAAGQVQAELRTTVVADESRSRQLAYAALSQLEVDPERSILLALEANNAAPTDEAEDALRRALGASHVRLAWRVRTSAGRVREMHYSPDGRHVLTLAESVDQPGWPDDSLSPQVWDANTGKLLFTLHGHTAPVIHVEYSAGGTHILSAGEDHSVRMWRASDGMLILMRQTYRDQITCAALSPDLNRIAVVTSEGPVHIWKADSGEELLELRDGFAGNVEVEWSNDGNLLLGRSISGMTVWNTYSGELLYKIDAPARDAVGARFSPDSRRLVAAERTGVSVWEAYSGDWIQSLNILDETAQGGAQISFSSDGMRLLTTLSQPRLWDEGTGWLIFTFPAPDAQAYLSPVPPGGNLVATCCDGSSVTVWRIEGTSSFRSAGILHGDMSDLWGFSPDGRSLLTSSKDGTLRVWDIMPLDKLPDRYEDLLALAHTRLTRELTCEERQAFLGEHGICATPTPAP
jgi:WD40 repeat protein